jgi:hypothetical protein
MEKGRNGESDESSRKMDNLGQMFFWCTIFCTFGRTTAGFTSNLCKESNYICPSVLSHKRSPASCGQQRKVKKNKIIVMYQILNIVRVRLLVYIRSFTEMDDKIQHGIL